MAGGADRGGCSPHGWTTDTLEQHLSRRISDLEKLISTRIDDVEKNVLTAMAAADKAITKSDMAMEKRLDSMNEFRAALGDQSTRLLPRTEYIIQHSSLIEKMTVNTDRITKLESRGEGRQQGISTTTGVLIQIIASAASIAVVIGVIMTMRH